MARSLHHLSSLFLFVSLLSLLCILSPSSCFDEKLLNLSVASPEWSLAGASWYGDPSGSGSNGGACGYGDAVGKPPFSSMVTAGNPSLFKSGKGCGTCYQVRCSDNSACSGDPVTVVITDSCPGGPCLSDPIHFDMSGTAFGSMAIPGKANQLRNAGVVQLHYRRVACRYPGFHVAFRVDLGSNAYYFAVVLEYEGGDGDLASVDLKQATRAPSSGNDGWLAMERSWGAVWMLNAGWELRAPFSLRLTSLTSGKTAVADRVIPAGWQPGETYMSVVNFEN